MTTDTDTDTLTIFSVNPAQGTSELTHLHETTSSDVEEICARAAAAAPHFEAAGRAGRAVFLRAIADELESAREPIVRIAMRETGLPDARLNGELTRTCYQMRLFGDVLDEGSYLEATIDHAGDTPMGPGPDLRRMLVPLGPVAVFGASNFPLAFSVPGGDTASALAAGSPVVVKAHSSHPETSAACFDALVRAAAATQMPDGVVGIVYGQAAGAALVADPRITAVGFTGSLGGGKALLDIISRRDDPIPFYGELASLNPVIVTENAAAARADEIAAGLVASVTASAGQLCTKPGLVFVPTGEAGDALVAGLRTALADVDAPVVLNERIRNSYNDISVSLSRSTAVEVRTTGREAGPEGFRVTPTVLEVNAQALSPEITEECFGPFAVVARYDSDEHLRRGLDVLPASLTATVHSEPGEDDCTSALTELLRPKAGRLLYNGYPTGVVVSWAQTHGGPWPATNTLHTSVGTSAIRRFLRPVTWQDAPASVLPAELQDGDSAVPRRIDGRLTLPAAG
ncbi:aldehyde dehydrogenase (NADP(+)) [Rhodococcus sp. T2V]|uniref:aldehyde dehydrogenase (NADP(+)) n=1 Tax=Rhodococcus sp. T2V TaxID=3034164 RepID=UPI0023E22423|nr:aldehyde dehydrogenase (NADP(+)) [Rhodococcus sp. T2V]MDF3305319.1 aldehyde dehydrogenase (NADP(+)) [Rhodococcus sp. T2V]